MLLLPFVLVISCATGTGTGEQHNQAEQENSAETMPETPPQETAQAEPDLAEVFDPTSISEETYSTTKANIQNLVEELNSIIRARNYNSWLQYLDKSYLDKISSREFLDERTEELYRRDQIVAQNMGRDPKTITKRILRTPRDYFSNVVVPSRANDHVDDITFISGSHVRAYTVDSRGTKLILYDLAMIDGKWKIVS